MTQLEIVKSFLEDTDIQAKYGLTPDDVAQMTMTTQYNANAQVLVGLIRQMVNVVEDKTKTTNVAAAVLNNHLENALR